MNKCPGCDRFIEPDEANCPFCDHHFGEAGSCQCAGRSNWVTLGTALASFVGMSAVVACGITAPQPAYGVPTPSCPDVIDEDAPSYCRPAPDAMTDTGVNDEDAEESAHSGE